MQVQSTAITNLESNKKVLLIVCAHNEENNIKNLLENVSVPKDFLLVDDGSTDKTFSIALDKVKFLLSHSRRLGKQVSLRDAVQFALMNNYEVVIEAGADAKFDFETLKAILSCFNDDQVGAVSVRQRPLGNGFLWYVERIFWDTLANAKAIQMKRFGSCYLGGVMYAFRTDFFRKKPYLAKLINDDEELDEIIRSSGAKIVFLSQCVVGFESSFSLKHLLYRRIRMVLGHYIKGNSHAPSMSKSMSLESFLRTIISDIKLIPFALIAFPIEIVSHIVAYLQRKDESCIKKYILWPRQ